MTYEISDWNRMCNKECEKLPQSCECPLDCYKLTPKNVARSTFFCAGSTWDLVADGGGTVMVWMSRWGWWYYLKGTYLYNSVHACVVLRWCRWADGVWGSLTWALIPQSALVRQSLNFKPNWSRWFKGLDKGITQLHHLERGSTMVGGRRVAFQTPPKKYRWVIYVWLILSGREVFFKDSSQLDPPLNEKLAEAGSSVSRSVQREIGEVELRLIETEIEVKITQHSSKVLYPACTICEGGDTAAEPGGWSFSSSWFKSRIWCLNKSLFSWNKRTGHYEKAC